MNKGNQNNTAGGKGSIYRNPSRKNSQEDSFGNCVYPNILSDVYDALMLITDELRRIADSYERRATAEEANAGVMEQIAEALKEIGSIDGLSNAISAKEEKKDDNTAQIIKRETGTGSYIPDSHF